jgi:hypothetical protein
MKSQEQNICSNSFKEITLIKHGRFVSIAIFAALEHGRFASISLLQKYCPFSLIHSGLFC